VRFALQNGQLLSRSIVIKDCAASYATDPRE
jgi:hypothetical protein